MVSHQKLLLPIFLMSSSMDIIARSLLLVTLCSHSIALLAQTAPPVSSRITVVGAVYCDTCINNGFSRYSYFLAGVDVHIQCRFNANSPKTAETITFSVNRTTDNHGVYKLDIPSVDGVDCVDGPPIQSSCQATLIGSSAATCDVPALKAATNDVSVKSKEEYLCVYSFTPLSFRPSKRNATLCGKQAKASSDSASSSKFFLPPKYALPTQAASQETQTSTSFPFTNPSALSFPFPSPPPSLPFPFPHVPTYPTTPALFPPPPPPSFNLGDPKTWAPHIPLTSPPPPMFNLRDPNTWTPLVPPHKSNPRKQNP